MLLSVQKKEGKISRNFNNPWRSGQILLDHNRFSEIFSDRTPINFIFPCNVPIPYNTCPLSFLSHKLSTCPLYLPLYFCSHEIIYIIFFFYFHKKESKAEHSFFITFNKEKFPSKDHFIFILTTCYNILLAVIIRSSFWSTFVTSSIHWWTSTMTGHHYAFSFLVCP